MIGKNVWLITWEGTANDITDENRIAGILTSRYSSSYVEKLVDFLYNRTIYDVHDMVYYVNKRKDREGRYKVLGTFPGYIIWGSNPFLFARIVKEFNVEYDDKKNAEIISWVENAVYGNDKTNGFKIKKFESEKRRSITRQKHKPIANELNNT